MPRRLRAILDEKGYVTLKEFAATTGCGYKHALSGAQSKEIPATDISSPGSPAMWRIYDAPIEQWFLERSNTKPDNTFEFSASDAPNFYDADSNWIPPDER